MAVHDVDMDPVGAGGVDRADFLAELREIGGEDRRGDNERAMHQGLIDIAGFAGAVRLTRHAGTGNARRRDPALFAGGSLRACRFFAPGQKRSARKTR